MADRIDHAAEAQKWIEYSADLNPETDWPRVAHASVLATTHAALAGVEQQRIANLIALEVSNRIDTGIFQTGDEEETPWGQQTRLVLTDEIREALGQS